MLKNQNINLSQFVQVSVGRVFFSGTTLFIIISQQLLQKVFFYTGTLYHLVTREKNLVFLGIRPPTRRLIVCLKV